MKKFLLLFIGIVMACGISYAQEEPAYTVKFATGTNGNLLSNAKGTLAQVLETPYLEIFASKTEFKTIVPKTQYGVRLGQAGSGGGIFNAKLADDYKVNATKVVLTGATYKGSGSNPVSEVTISFNGVAGEAIQTNGVTGTVFTQTFELDGSLLTDFKLSTTAGVFITSVDVYTTTVEKEKIELDAANLTLTAGEQVLEADEAYDLAAGTVVNFAYTTDNANADITYSYIVGDEPEVVGNSYTFSGEQDVMLTVKATSANSVEKTVILQKVYPTECPMPVFSVENGAEVQIGSTVTVACEGAETLMWTVNDTDIEGMSYTITEAAGTELSFFAIASVTGKAGELTAENSIKVKVVEPTYATFVFNDKSVENPYGLIPTGDTNVSETNTEIKEGDVTIALSGKYLLWDTDYTLRLYSLSSMTISVPDGYIITEIVFDAKYLSVTADSGTLASQKWTSGDNAVNAVKFTRSNRTYINTITVNYAAKPAKEPEIVAVDAELMGEEAGNALIDYTIHVKNHKEGSVYTLVFSLTDEDGVNETNATVTEHTLYVEPAEAPRRVAALAEGATHRLTGVAKLPLTDKITYTKGTVKYAVGNDVEAAEPTPITVNQPITSSIVEVGTEGASATEWFDLSGRRVAAPVKGVYVRKQGNRVSKHVF